MDAKVNKKLKGDKSAEKKKNILSKIGKEYKKDMKEIKLEDSDLKKLGVDLDGNDDKEEDDKEGGDKEGGDKEGGDKEGGDKEGGDKEGKDELPFSNIIQIESKRLIKKYIIMIKKTI